MICSHCGTEMERVPLRGVALMRCPECGRVWKRDAEGGVHTYQPPEQRAKPFLEAVGA